MRKIIADAHSDVVEYAYDNKMNMDDRMLSFNLIDVQNRLVLFMINTREKDMIGLKNL